MFGSFGWMELLLILIIVLIIFGAGKIPQLGEGIGKAIKGFKQSVQDSEDNEADDPTRQIEESSTSDNSSATVKVPDTQESPSHSDPISPQHKETAGHS